MLGVGILGFCEHSTSTKSTRFTIRVSKGFRVQVRLGKVK